MLFNGALQNKSGIVIFEINSVKLEQLARNWQNYKKERECLATLIKTEKQYFNTKSLETLLAIRNSGQQLNLCQTRAKLVNIHIT